jgi:hypothetical protein
MQKYVRRVSRLLQRINQFLVRLSDTERMGGSVDPRTLDEFSINQLFSAAIALRVAHRPMLSDEERRAGRQESITDIIARLELLLQQSENRSTSTSSSIYTDQTIATTPSSLANALKEIKELLSQHIALISHEVHRVQDTSAVFDYFLL